MNIKLTLGERLKDLRVERNLKLEMLAEQTGLSKSALSKYESDDVTDLSIYAVTTLAEFYGVTTDYLLGVTEKKTPRCSPFGLASERWRSGCIKKWKIQSSAVVRAFGTSRFCPVDDRP